MKKVISMFVALMLLMSVSVTAFAEDMSAGTGEAQVYSHIYSSYSISIPATIDLRNGESGEVTIIDASIEDGYSVKVFATNLSENGIKLTHTDGMTTIDCVLMNIELNANASAEIPLTSFASTDIENGTATKYFSLQPDTYGKPGDYSGTLQYSFSCTQD